MRPPKQFKTTNRMIKMVSSNKKKISRMKVEMVSSLKNRSTTRTSSSETLQTGRSKSERIAL